MKPAVDLIDNHDGTWSVRVYQMIVFTGMREECEKRVAFEGEGVK